MVLLPKLWTPMGDDVGQTLAWTMAIMSFSPVSNSSHHPLYIFTVWVLELLSKLKNKECVKTLINLYAPLYFLLTARNANKLVKSMIMAGLKSIRVLLFKQKQDRYCFLHSLLTVNNPNIKMFSKVSKPEIFLWNFTPYRIKTCYQNGALFLFQFSS
jgi:hypothetical protein